MISFLVETRNIVMSVLVWGLIGYGIVGSWQAFCFWTGIGLLVTIVLSLLSYIGQSHRQ